MPSIKCIRLKLKEEFNRHDFADRPMGLAVGNLHLNELLQSPTVITLQ